MLSLNRTTASPSYPFTRPGSAPSKRALVDVDAEGDTVPWPSKRAVVDVHDDDTVPGPTKYHKKRSLEACWSRPGG